MTPHPAADSLRFTELRPQGEGASARVSCALDRWTGREVVLKEARALGQGGHGFLKEARLLQMLRAPVFPELVEFDPGGDQHPARLVLEKRPGPALSELTDSPAWALAAGEADWIAVQVLQGLSELAEHGWIHGDLGPANLLLDGSRASLLDLGLARSTHDRHRARSGTLSVMPPEILSDGLPHPRSDIFSLGALLFQLLSGASPFPENPDEAVGAILAGRLRPAGRAATHPLFPFILRCLHTEPGRRPAPREALAELAAALPAARTALLLPRRGPGNWEAGLLEDVVTRLAAGACVRLHSGSAGPWRARLNQLQVEVSARRGPLLGIQRAEGESLLDWLARRVDHPGRLQHYPELAGALERRRGGRDLLRLVLGFLDDQLGRPRQGLCWLTRPGDPDAARLDDLVALCGRQGRPLLILELDTAPADALRLEAPGRDTWQGWLRRPAPGIELSEAAAAALDALTGGQSEHIPPLVARCISEERLLCRNGLWELSPLGLPAQGARGAADLDALAGPVRRALLRACAWLEPAPAGAWRSHVLQGRERELESLEGAGWLRDRGDGQREPQAGVRELLGLARLQPEHLEILHELWKLPEPPAELCLLHLGRCELGLVDPLVARDVLLAAPGLVDPARRVRLIEELLPSLARGEVGELETLLATGLLAQGRPAEARRLLRGLLRRARGGSVLPLINRLAFVYSLLGRNRLALRLLQRARELATEPLDRLLLRVTALDPLLRSGQHARAAAELEACLPDLRDCDPAAGPQQAHALNSAGAAAFQLGRTEDAAHLWTQLDRAGRQLLQVQQRVWLANNLGILHLQAGRIEQARGELEQAGREAALYHLERYELMARVNLALAQLRRGAADQAVRELEPALQQARDLQEPVTELAVLDHLGESWAALGDLEGAERVWREELARAVELDSPQDELDPLVQLLRLDLDLGLAPRGDLLARFQEVAARHDTPPARQWRLFRDLLDTLAPERGKGPGPGVDWPADLAPALRLQAAGREVPRGELLHALLELDPRLDGVRVALAMLEHRLAWLADWSTPLREEREMHRLQQIRLLGLEGELAARRENWPEAGQRLGRAVRLLHGMAQDLSPAWQARLRESPWLERLLERSEECLLRVTELERRDHGHTAGTVGRAAGA
ncbi:MAG: protein kinase [Candidatus Delongbacteria bacterium]